MDESAIYAQYCIMNWISFEIYADLTSIWTLILMLSSHLKALKISFVIVRNPHANKCHCSQLQISIKAGHGVKNRIELSGNECVMPHITSTAKKGGANFSTQLSWKVFIAGPGQWTSDFSPFPTLFGLHGAPLHESGFLQLFVCFLTICRAWRSFGWAVSATPSPPELWIREILYLVLSYIKNYTTSHTSVSYCSCCVLKSLTRQECGFAFNSVILSQHFSVGGLDFLKST